MEYPSIDILAYLELRQDLFFDKIPKDKITYYLQESIHFGEKQAMNFQDESLLDLYEKHNIEIVELEGDGSIMKVRLRAQSEFNPDGNHKVYLYKESINELAKLSGLTYDSVRDIHLAHEFFHFLEGQQQAYVSESLEPVVRMQLLKKKLYANIQRCSEIGAHIFSMKMNHLPCLPNYYDYAFLIEKKEFDSTIFQKIELEMSSL